MTDIAQLEALGLADLRSEWMRRYGGEPPRLRTRELLALALAHRIQTDRYGGLSRPVQKRVAELQRRFSSDRDYNPVPGPQLMPGSSIIKSWRGARHEVIVTEQGFSYRGEDFGTLSEVARHITGTRWNGLVFFGLKTRAK